MCLSYVMRILVLNRCVYYCGKFLETTGKGSEYSTVGLRIRGRIVFILHNFYMICTDIQIRQFHLMTF